MKQKTELYSAAFTARRRRINRIWTVLTVAIALAALLVCIVLCTKLTTANERQIELTVIVLSGIAGCVVIFLGKNAVYDGRRELRHIAALSDETPQTVRGRVELVPGSFRIPGSIRVQTLLVHGADGTQTRASVNVRTARYFRDRPEPITLYTAHGFVVAFEE